MLEIKNISAGYGRQAVLKDVSAVFEKGRLTSVIGVNGCGKSTLLKAILCILPLEKGELRVDGQDLTLMKRTEIAKKIAYLPQGKATPDMTVEQMVLHGRFPYLSYPRRYTEKDIEIARAAMRTLGISDVASKPLYALSGGMRQIAYIAMALAQDTDYILLDEPTAYLDIAHQLELMRVLRGLADSGKGIVTVMHDLPMAFDLSDDIAVMEKGAIRGHKKPSELYGDPLIEEIFGVKIRSLDENGKYYYDL